MPIRMGYFYSSMNTASEINRLNLLLLILRRQEYFGRKHNIGDDFQAEGPQFDVQYEYLADKDLDNVPTQISNEVGNVVKYAYDYSGTRIKKEYNAGLGCTYVNAFYQVRSDGQITKHIFDGVSRIAVEKIDNGRTNAYWFHTDHLGSSALLTAEDGNVVQTISYTPFGETRENLIKDTNGNWVSPTSSSNEFTQYKFTGQEYDPETGFYNYNARLYDPMIGRFLSPDSEITDPSLSQSYNRYTYCNNNPVNYADPTGHNPIMILIGAAIGAVVGAIIGGINAAINHQNIWAGIGWGAAIGALTGAGVGLFGFSLGVTSFWEGVGLFFGGGVAGGGAGYFVGSIATGVSSPAILWPFMAIGATLGMLVGSLAQAQKEAKRQAEAQKRMEKNYEKFMQSFQDYKQMQDIEEQIYNDMFGSLQSSLNRLSLPIIDNPNQQIINNLIIQNDGITQNILFPFDLIPIARGIEGGTILIKSGVTIAKNNWRKIGLAIMLGVSAAAGKGKKFIDTLDELRKVKNIIRVIPKSGK